MAAPSTTTAAVAPTTTAAAASTRLDKVRFVLPETSLTSQLLATADENADEVDAAVRERVYSEMKAEYDAFRTKADYQWRLARAAYLFGQTFLGHDENRRQQLVVEGGCDSKPAVSQSPPAAKNAALEACAIEPDNAHANKYAALTLGVACDFAPTKEKIQMGKQFKVHVDKAIDTLPEDAALHHLRARWAYSVAGGRSRPITNLHVQNSPGSSARSPRRSSASRRRPRTPRRSPGSWTSSA